MNLAAPETKEQALDLVAAIFVRAGERLEDERMLQLLKREKGEKR